MRGSGGARGGLRAATAGFLGAGQAALGAAGGGGLGLAREGEGPRRRKGAERLGVTARGVGGGGRGVSLASHPGGGRGG